jgi:hypothetical protein
MAVVSQLLNHLRPQDARAADHHDLHDFSLKAIAAVKV